MKAKRKRHNAEFKAQVALEAAKELKTMAELASQFGIHANQISDWKKTLVGRGAELFKTGAKDVDKDGLIANRTLNSEFIREFPYRTLNSEY